MASVREQHEQCAGSHPDHRRQNLNQNLLRRLKVRVEATDAVVVQERQHRENDQLKQSMSKVTDPKLVLGHVNLFRGGRRPEPLGGDDGVVALFVGAGVAVGEAGEAAVEGAGDEEAGSDDLVGGGAVAGVGGDGVEELEEEDGAGGEELDEVT